MYRGDRRRLCDGVSTGKASPAMGLSSGAERANIRALREIPVCPCVSLFADYMNMNNSPDALASGLFAFYLSNFHAMVASICFVTS